MELELPRLLDQTCSNCSSLRINCTHSNRRPKAYVVFSHYLPVSGLVICALPSDVVAFLSPSPESTLIPRYR